MQCCSLIKLQDRISWINATTNCGCKGFVTRRYNMQFRKISSYCSQQKQAYNLQLNWRRDSSTSSSMNFVEHLLFNRTNVDRFCFKYPPSLTLYLTHLFPMHPSSTPWKHKKTLRFSDVFRGRETVGNKFGNKRIGEGWEQNGSEQKGWEQNALGTYALICLDFLVV